MMAPGRGNKSKQVKRGHPSGTASDESMSILPEEEIIDIVNKAVSRTIDTLVAQLKAELKSSLVDMIKEQLSVYRNELDIVAFENEMIKKDVEKNRGILEELQVCLSKMQEDIVRTNQLVNQNEQYSRQWSIRIHGHKKAGKEEDCCNEVVSIIQTKLELPDISEGDFELAHRVGKPVNGRPQSIIAKFYSRSKRQLVLANRSKLKGSGYVITEDLTVLNQKLLNRARFSKKIKSVWSWNGNIWAITQEDKRLKLVPFDDFNDRLLN